MIWVKHPGLTGSFQCLIQNYTIDILYIRKQYSTVIYFCGEKIVQRSICFQSINAAKKNARTLLSNHLSNKVFDLAQEITFITKFRQSMGL